MSDQEAGEARAGGAAAILVAAIRVYQRFVSPLLGARCRFYPSCSAYAVRAIQVHGAARGSWLASIRLVKCQPMHPGGVDHVPPPTGRARARREQHGRLVRAGPSERGSS